MLPLFDRVTYRQTLFAFKILKRAEAFWDKKHLKYHLMRKNNAATALCQQSLTGSYSSFKRNIIIEGKTHIWKK